MLCHSQFVKKINGKPKPTAWEVTQLDRTSVKVVGEMEHVLIRLSTNNNVEDKVPGITTTNQDPKQINNPTKLMEEQVEVNKENTVKPEEPEEEIPTENQPVEEEVKSIGEEKARTPPFLLTLEMLNHKVHNRSWIISECYATCSLQTN